MTPPAGLSRDDADKARLDFVTTYTSTWPFGYLVMTFCKLLEGIEKTTAAWTTLMGPYFLLEGTEDEKEERLLLFRAIFGKAKVYILN